MLSIRQLGKTIDSLKKSADYYGTKAKTELSPFFAFTKFQDTGLVAIDAKSVRKISSIKDIIPDSAFDISRDRALGQVSSAKGNVDFLATDYENKQKEISSNEIEWHRKFTLSIACLVLFMIGAPLGSIIRKGGLGTPLVFAVIFFVLFHLLNTFGEKSVKGGVLPAYIGMWLSCAVLFPVGFFLTYKAMKDSQLFNSEYYYRTFKKLKPLIANLRNKRFGTSKTAI
jgi:lipopolysaccharide export system permease protein